MVLLEDQVYGSGLAGERSNEVKTKVFFPSFRDLSFLRVGIYMFVLSGVYWLPRFSLEFPRCSEEAMAFVV